MNAAEGGTPPVDVSMEEIVALCKRRGFVFPSSEIYGGLGSTYDYGHYGVLLKNNVKGEWWRAMLQERDDIVALDSAILQHPRVWEASGHLEGFTDPLVQCLGKCKKRWREDHLREAVEAEGGDPDAELRCPQCGGELSEPRQFNLMFETHVGPVAGEGSEVFLRPETAQGIFINFKNVLGFARKKPPFGIAQIGKSFRNEITPGNFIFRTREFEQMEMEFFVPAGRRRAAGTGPGSRSASAGTPSSASGPSTCGSVPTTTTSSPTTPRGRATSSTSSRSAGRSSRASPTAATSTSPSTPSSAARSSSTSTSGPKSAMSPT